MAINLGGGFHIGSKQPIDDRLIMSKSEMLSVNENTFPDVYMCICSDDGAIYTFNINNEANAETGKFRAFEGGSSGTSTEGNIVTYSLPSQLGLDDNAFSIYEIINAMKALDKAATGMFSIRPNIGISTAAPTPYGVLMVEAIGQDVSVRYVGTNAAGNTYGNWFGYVEFADDGAVSTIDWQPILHDVDGIWYEAPHDLNINNVRKALDDLYDLAYYQALEITSFTANPAGGVFEIGTTVSAPTFRWTYNNKVMYQELTDCIVATKETRTATYSSDITSDKTFTLEAEDKRVSGVSKSISYKFVNPYYVGVSATNVLDDIGVTALTKKVEVKGSKTINYTTSQSYMVFAYPSSYGAISSVIDQNGFNVTSSFVQSEVAINGVDYYVYCSKQCSGSYTMKFSY